MTIYFILNPPVNIKLTRNNFLFILICDILITEFSKTSAKCIICDIANALQINVLIIYLSQIKTAKMSSMKNIVNILYEKYRILKKNLITI